MFILISFTCHRPWLEEYRSLYGWLSDGYTILYALLLIHFNLRRKLLMWNRIITFALIDVR